MIQSVEQEMENPTNGKKQRNSFQRGENSVEMMVLDVVTVV